MIHHLFPGINQYYYPAIAPIVKETCKEYGVPYNVKVGVRGWADIGLYDLTGVASLADVWRSILHAL